MLFVSQQHSRAILSGCLTLHDKGLGCTHRLGVLGQQVGRVRGIDPFPLPRYHPCCLTHTVSQVRCAEQSCQRAEGRSLAFLRAQEATQTQPTASTPLAPLTLPPDSTPEQTLVFLS